MPADVSDKQPKKVLTGCWDQANVMLAAIIVKQQQRCNQQHEYLHNQQLHIQRRCEEKQAKLKREIVFTKSYQWLSQTILLSLSNRQTQSNI